MATQYDFADQIITNCQRIILMVQVQIANPTQLNIDNIVDAAQRAGVMQPKPTTSIDGESYDWSGYMTMLTNMVKEWIDLRQTLGGPFEIKVYGGW